MQKINFMGYFPQYDFIFHVSFFSTEWLGPKPRDYYQNAPTEAALACSGVPVM